MYNLIFDIETIPDPDLPKDLRPECKLGNLKDPDKIAAKQKEYEETGQIKDMSVNTLMNKIVSYQAWSSKDEKLVAVPEVCSEEDLIECIWDDFENHETLIGHNIINFDLRTILNRSMILGITPTRKVSLKRYQTHPVYDTMEIMAGWNSSQWKSLDWIAKRLGLEGKTNESCKVYEWYQEGAIHKIHEHCKQDVLLNKGVYERMIKYYQ
jgi:predicted PolB exonuclease-like 3'-5' exonuclease